MTDTKQIQDAIRETLQRNLEILVADLPSDVRTLTYWVDVREMLDACAANLAVMVDEWRRE